MATPVASIWRSLQRRAKPRNQPRFASTVAGRTFSGEFVWNSVRRVAPTAPGTASGRT